MIAFQESRQNTHAEYDHETDNHSHGRRVRVAEYPSHAPGSLREQISYTHHTLLREADPQEPRRPAPWLAATQTDFDDLVTEQGDRNPDQDDHKSRRVC